MPGKIAYIGFGALGKQISVLLRQTIKEIPEEVFFDDQAVKQGLPRFYSFSEYKDDRFADYDFFVCLGYKQLLKKAEITEHLSRLNRNMASYVHPSCIINPSSHIERGCIVYQGCNIDQRVILKTGVLLNNSVTVSHDTVIGKNTFLAPGVVVSGQVQIGEQCFIGAGSVIANDITIGNQCIIGAGSVITKDIPDHASVIGNPMRILDKKIVLR